MASLLNILPEDCSRLIWSKVFNQCIQNIPTAAFKFYIQSRNKADKIEAEVCVKINSLEKRKHKLRRTGNCEMKINMLRYMRSELKEKQSTSYKILKQIIEGFNERLI
jgi:hypothetical protein